MRVLVVEDYAPIREAVVKGLVEASFAVDAAEDGEDGLWYVGHTDYDVVILDVMLPKVDGLSLLRHMRRLQTPARVILLTARDAIEDKVAALNLGADDYLVKPFVFDELLARVQALVRRKHEQPSPRVEIGNLTIDTSAQVVRRGGELITLTKREYALLHFLAMRQEAWVSRTEIWDNIYPFESNAQSNVVDVYIRYLRRKLERPGWPPIIHTRRGFGYSLGEREADA
jgi:DNA-binding response OmpR family regulator